MGQSGGPPAGPARRVGVAVTSLCLVQFVDVLGVTVVVTSLPAMLASLHAPDSLGSLIATGYAMFFGGLLMLGARLGDRYGHRRTILASLAVFALGALVAATAPSVLALAAGRCLQGAAAAASVPSALRLLTTITAEGPARQRAIAAWSAAGAAAGASGFVVGGIVTDLTSWRVIFWAYLPLAAALAAVVAVSVPRDGGRRQAESLNLAGSLIFTAAVMAFVVGATVIDLPGGRLAGALLLAACVVLAGGFVLADRRAVAPLLPRELIRSRPLRLGTLGALLNTATTSSVLTLVTLYLQNSLQRTPLQAAATLLPFSLAVIAGSTLAAAVQRRTGQPRTDRRRTGQRRTGQRAGPPRLVAQRLVAAGLALIAVADAALIPLAALAWAVPVCAAGAGAGIGLSSVAATGLGTDVASRRRGAASGIINTAAQLGTAVGIAALILVAAATGETPALGTPPPRIAWAVAVLAAAAGAVRFALARPEPAAVTGGEEASAREGGPAGQGGRAREGGPAGQGGRAREGGPAGQGGRAREGGPAGQGGRAREGGPAGQGGRAREGGPAGQGAPGSGGCLRLKDALPGGRGGCSPGSAVVTVPVGGGDGGVQHQGERVPAHVRQQRHGRLPVRPGHFPGQCDRGHLQDSDDCHAQRGPVPAEEHPRPGRVQGQVDAESRGEAPPLGPVGTGPRPAGGPGGQRVKHRPDLADDLARWLPRGQVERSIPRAVHVGRDAARHRGARGRGPRGQESLGCHGQGPARLPAR